MRMQEITAQSGFPASTVRYYLSQGLLPEPQRPTRNSAIYDQRHLTALNALKTIKAAAPELPLAQIHRVMQLVDQGVETEVALALHRAVAGSIAHSDQLSLEELAEEAGVSPPFVQSLIKRGILAPIPGQSGFDAADLETLNAVALLESMAPGEIDAVAKIAAHIRAASALEMELRNRVSSGQDANATAAISQQMQEWGNFWHSYLFARYRLADIKEQGLAHAEYGKDEDTGDGA